jgi:hypothetical protein
MSWLEILRAVFRRWWVLLTVLAVTLTISYAIRSVGSEFIAQTTLTVVGPPTENPLLDSSKPSYRAIVIIAVFELYDDSYRDELRADGLSDDFSVDFYSTFPAVSIVMKAPTYAGARAAAERLGDDFVRQVDSVQADRNVPKLSRLGASVIEVIQVPPRPAASKRALVGLLLGSVMISGASAYGVDQFLLPGIRDVRRFRRARRFRARFRRSPRRVDVA